MVSVAATPASAQTATGAQVYGDGGSAHAGAVPTAGAQRMAPRAAAASVPAPTGYPVKGIDVASWQGNVNWSQVAAAGVKFAYAKATEGTSYKNPYFGSQYNGAKSAGLFAGAYVFARPDSTDAVAQANYFIDNAQFLNDGKTLPAMLDIEWPYFSQPAGLTLTPDRPWSCWGRTTSEMVSWIRGFVNQVYARTGRKTLIYTNLNWWNPCTGSSTAFSDQLLNIASYQSNPPSTLPTSWSKWTFWQYSDSGPVPGDQDVFNGSLTALAALTGKVQIGWGWGLPDTAVYFADLDGDGRAEVISKENGTLYTFRNYGYTADGRVLWGGKVAIGWGWGLPDTSVYFADLDGDGRAEVIAKVGGTLYAFHNYGLTSDGRVLWGGMVAIGWGWGVPDTAVYFADLSGDHRAEVIAKQNGVLYAFRNYGYTADGRVLWGGMVAIGWGWGIPDTSLYWTDLYGDGRALAIAKENGTLYAFRNYGYTSNNQVLWGGKTAFGYGWTTSDPSLHWADLSGDHRAEAVSKENGTLYGFHGSFNNSPGL